MVVQQGNSLAMQATMQVIRGVDSRANPQTQMEFHNIIIHRFIAEAMDQKFKSK